MLFRSSAASSSEYSSEEDDETWEERAWRLLINKASFSGWEYPRARPPYREYAPQIPFFPHLGGAGPRRLQVWLPQTLVFGLGADPGSGGAQQAWLSCDADGCIQRRDEFDPDADVMPVFQSNFRPRDRLEAIFGPKHHPKKWPVGGQKQRFAAQNDRFAAFLAPWRKLLCRHFGCFAGAGQVEKRFAQPPNPSPALRVG